MKGPGRADNGNLHLSEFEVQVFPARQSLAPPVSDQAARQGRLALPEKVKIRRASADFDQSGWMIAHALDGDLKTAWGVDPAEGQPHHAVFELERALKLEAGATIAVLLKQVHGSSHVIGRFRLSVTDAPANVTALPMLVQVALKTPREQRTQEQSEAIASFVLKNRAGDELARLPAPA